MSNSAPLGYFQDQVEFFRQKLNLPTESWTDIWEEQHDRSFVVAGAMRNDLLADLRASVDKAISQGTTLEEFRKDFDAIVAKHGWEYNGGRNWRSKVIYDTNISTSYAAGRWQQIQQDKKLRPYLRYRHLEGERYPRPDHLAWDGLVLAVDDPWWVAHFPPNGWGCKCWVGTLSKREVAEQGVTVSSSADVEQLISERWKALQADGRADPEAAAPIGSQTVTVGSRGPSPRSVETPRGVDPGFGYTPGASTLNSVAQAALESTAQLPLDLGAQSAAEALALPRIQAAIDEAFGELVTRVVAAGDAHNEAMVVGALSPDIVEALAAEGVEPATAPIMARDVEILHALRTTKASETAAGVRRVLTADELSQLPAMLSDADAVLFDARDSTLLYIFSPDNGPRDAIKIVVRIGYSAKIAGQGKQTFNAFKTALYVDSADLEAMIARGQAKLIEGEL